MIWLVPLYIDKDTALKENLSAIIASITKDMQGLAKNDPQVSAYNKAMTVAIARSVEQQQVLRESAVFAAERRGWTQQEIQQKINDQLQPNTNTTTSEETE